MEVGANSYVILNSLGTAYVYGQEVTPCTLADAKGNIGVVMV